MIEFRCERCDRTIKAGSLEAAVLFGWRFRQTVRHREIVHAFCPTHREGAKP